MRKVITTWGLRLAISLVLLAGGISSVAADSPVVHAILFYSPTCGHCSHVSTEVLEPLQERYSTQFKIARVNVAEAEGQALYQAALQKFNVSDDRQGVPTMIIGDVVLVGSLEIPEQLPGLLESNLAQGGLDWPAIPGLEEQVQDSANLGDNEKSDWRALFARDPLGNGLSIFVLLGMVGSVLYNSLTLMRPATQTQQSRWRWALPPLVALGLVVAGYLAYVETLQVTAVCGPVGDCNAVQQSDFALLFGFLPIAVLGLLGYIGIGGAWIVARYINGIWADLAKLALLGMTWFGIGFSIYLTFLEPFVIGATCAWCLTSAVLMTLIFWVIMPLTLPTLHALRGIQIKDLTTFNQPHNSRG